MIVDLIPVPSPDLALTPAGAALTAANVGRSKGNGLRPRLQKRASLPVISAKRLKKARLRGELMRQSTGTLWKPHSALARQTVVEQTCSWFSAIAAMKLSSRSKSKWSSSLNTIGWPR